MCEAKMERLEERTDSSSLIVWDFDTLLSIAGKITIQKVNKEIEDLNNTYKPTLPNGHIQHTTLKNRGIHIQVNMEHSQY